MLELTKTSMLTLAYRLSAKKIMVSFQIQKGCRLKIKQNRDLEGEYVIYSPCVDLLYMIR